MMAERRRPRVFGCPQERLREAGLVRREEDRCTIPLKYCKAFPHSLSLSPSLSFPVHVILLVAVLIFVFFPREFVRYSRFQSLSDLRWLKFLRAIVIFSVVLVFNNFLAPLWFWDSQTQGSTASPKLRSYHIDIILLYEDFQNLAQSSALSIILSNEEEDLSPRVFEFHCGFPLSSLSSISVPLFIFIHVLQPPHRRHPLCPVWDLGLLPKAWRIYMILNDALIGIEVQKIFPAASREYAPLVDAVFDASECFLCSRNLCKHISEWYKGN
ncbi:uncharacterized protein LOC116247483 [Nymphaea colorata]|nr:uncharacterized protein LOC116247483 [Nymphaea colorata]